MITAAQRKAFFRLFPRACSVQGIPPGEEEAYRHDLIREATGKTSLKEVGPGVEFDKLMALLAREAQDHTAAMRYALADGQRLARMCEQAVRQCFELARTTEGDCYGYLKGILRQAAQREALVTRGAEWWLDLTLPQLQRLFQMLDTHRRRMLHRVLVSNRLAEDREGYRVAMPMRFDLYAQYRWEGETCVMRLLSTLPRPEIRVRIMEEDLCYA